MTPTNVNYGNVTGGLSAGRFAPSAAGYDTLITQIAAQTPGSWLKINVNRFDSVWLPVDLRNRGGLGPGGLYAYGGVAVDHVHHRLVFWGGGHSDSSDNEPYIFDFTRGLWSVGYLPSDSEYINDVPQNRSVDLNASPPSSHTYFTSAYLPRQNRYFMTSGYASPNASPAQVWDPVTKNALRTSGAYSLDLSRVGLGFVGGDTGAHSHRGAYASVNYYGANAWRLHDWFKRSPAPAMGQSRSDCGAFVTDENGHDVVYLTSNHPYVGRILSRIEIVDQNPDNDIITTMTLADPAVGAAGGGGALAFDPVKRIALTYRGAGATDPALYFLDFKRTTPSDWQLINQAGVSGASTLLSTVNNWGGLAFDTRRNVFVINQGNPVVWEFSTPAGDPTPVTGWTVSTPTIAAGAGPDYSGVGQSGTVMGTFRYAPDLGCCVLVQGQTQGNVWLYKPAGWTDPRT